MNLKYFMTQKWQDFQIPTVHSLQSDHFDKNLFCFSSLAYSNVDLRFDNGPILALKVSNEAFLNRSFRFFFFIKIPFIFGSGGPLKIRLLQCYEVLWIHVINVICIIWFPCFDTSKSIVVIAVLYVSVCAQNPNHCPSRHCWCHHHCQQLHHQPGQCHNWQCTQNPHPYVILPISSF